jgi:hypothetical protein
MNTELVPINDLTPDPANARKHGERNLSAIIDSLRAFGQQKPIVVDRRGVVIAGNGTLEAAKRLGWEEIAVVRTELDPTQATAFGIADNRTAELAEWDEDVLVSLLDSLDDETRDLLHFDEKELEAMVPKATVEVVEDEVPDEVEPRTKPGDLWLLGRHRLLCGDSTKAEDVARLMDGATATMVHADPPYGMGKEKDGVANDNLYREKLDAFQMEWWRVWRPHLPDNGSAYIWGNAPDLWRLWYCGGLSESERMTIRNEIVWDKGGAAAGGILSKAQKVRDDIRPRPSGVSSSCSASRGSTRTPTTTGKAGSRFGRILTASERRQDLPRLSANKICGKTNMTQAAFTRWFV